MRVFRKALTVITAAGMMVLLASCGGSSDKTTTAAATTAASTAAAAAAGSSAAAESTAALPVPASYGEVTKLGNYKGIDLTVEDATVTDDDVTNQIKQTLSSNPVKTEVDRAAQNGDVVNIDYVGKKDGVAFDGGTAEKQDLTLGSNSFIEGFESGLVGTKKGDKKTLNLTFPANYSNTELAGKAVTFDVTVNSVSESKTPELTDDWVNTYTKGEETTVAAYKDKVKSDLEKSRKQSADTNAEGNALQALLGTSEFKTDDSAVAYECQQIKQSDDAQISAYASYGMTREQVLQNSGLTEETLKQQEQEAAENTVKETLLVQEIAKKENMKIEDSDYKYLEELSSQTKDVMVQNYGQDRVDKLALTYKVAKFIVDNANKTVETTSAAAETSSAPTETQTTESAAQ